jgi:type IV pilus biogenesis protein CpaD/CtpE
VGAADAPIQYAEYENALAIQVWLGDSKIQGNLRPVLEDLFDEMNSNSAEFEAGRISIGLVWLDPECIAPDDEEDVN